MEGEIISHLLSGGGGASVVLGALWMSIKSMKARIDRLEDKVDALEVEVAKLQDTTEEEREIADKIDVLEVAVAKLQDRSERATPLGKI